MTTIHLVTHLNAEIGDCFDASRSIDVHLLSAENTRERVVAGRMNGLCELGDTVTWEARHFGIAQKLTVEIIAMDSPYYFEDKMLKGAFKSMRHEHHFREQSGKTIMTDKFEYEVPFGIVGTIFDRLILKRYMKRFLETRNRILKSIVEKK